jgi:hypothetical protein
MRRPCMVGGEGSVFWHATILVLPLAAYVR